MVSQVHLREHIVFVLHKNIFVMFALSWKQKRLTCQYTFIPKLVLAEYIIPSNWSTIYLQNRINHSYGCNTSKVNTEHYNVVGTPKVPQCHQTSIKSQKTNAGFTGLTGLMMLPQTEWTNLSGKVT